jgi:hypothetical protein
VLTVELVVFLDSLEDSQRTRGEVIPAKDKQLTPAGDFTPAMEEEGALALPPAKV